ncbi:hypothetical protein F4813DRAFT_349919 [Daldinia decipiens]|uniref:uncharacterized protein n=1 Tax=Daldinia decipiens TaxID=326647 RepID=UPI0020C2CBE4|nr:uncharacterized protein F4813DRAFT_349919 [Daldinia decipiens]KAI1660420.1 hypothetical protein F4813DRAFT_349919 [Daldinia decipiens]
MPSPSFLKYEELIPELKLEIWRQASLSPGVHYFKIRPWIGRRGADLRVQRVELTPSGQPDSDPSVWRVRDSIAKADKYSWEIANKLLKGASAKELWRPQRGDHPGAVIDCDHDLVCIRFQGLISNPYIGRFGDFDKLSGIKRVAVEYKKNWRPSIMYNWPQPTFQCLCPNTIHEVTAVCPKTLEDFIPYFPDIDTFYFMVKLTSQAIKPLPPAPRGKKRSRQGVVKKEGGQQPEPTPIKSQARGKVAQMTSETFTKFRGRCFFLYLTGKNKAGLLFSYV